MVPSDITVVLLPSVTVMWWLMSESDITLLKASNYVSYQNLNGHKSHLFLYYTLLVSELENDDH